MSSLSSQYDILPGPFASQEFVTEAVAPIIIGSLLNLILWGVASSQFYEYVTGRRYLVDTFRLRLLVFSVFILATIQSGFQAWIIYHYSLCQSRTADVLFSPTLVEKIATVPVGIEGFLVQTYLAQRGSNLFKLQRNKIIYFVVSGLCIGIGFLGALLYLIGSFAVQANVATQQLPAILNIATAFWLYGCAFADISIAVVLVVLLRQRMVNQKGFQKSTDSMIKKLSTIALSSSTFTAFFASIPALLILAFSSDALHAGLLYAFVVELSSLYAISLLVNLNSREGLRAKLHDTNFPTVGVLSRDFPKTENSQLTSNNARNDNAFLGTAFSGTRLLNVATSSSTYEMDHLNEMRKGFEVGLGR